MQSEIPSSSARDDDNLASWTFIVDCTWDLTGCHCAVMSSTSINEKGQRLQAMHRKNPSGYATSRDEDDCVRSVQSAFTCPQDPLYLDVLS